MNTYLAMLKREFWENQGSFITLPLVLTALLFLACLYLVVWQASPESDFAMGSIFRDQNINRDIADTGTPAPDEYVLDFNKGELVKPEQRSDQLRGPFAGPLDEGIPNAPLYLIHIIFIVFMSFALLGYLFNSLHADRKDRSVLFWKSMPVSETSNVLIKLITATLAVPVLVTVISWVAQIIVTVMSMIFLYRIGSDPWTLIWSRLDLMQAFFEQLLYVLWLNLWFLPITAWLLFSSALAKRSPFMVAFMPFAMVFLLEYLIFGTSYAWGLIRDHFSAINFDMDNYMDERVRYGNIKLNFDWAKLTTGAMIAAVLLAGAVWLRDHRFEI